MIYFAKLPTGSIKIGYSEDVEARMGQLAAHYGCDLEVLHTMEGGREVERALHERFAHLRFGRTEQFRPGRDLADFIGLPLFVSANPETVSAQGADPDQKPMVRLNPRVVAMARLVAGDRGVATGDYISALAMEAVKRDYKSTLRSLLDREMEELGE